MKGKFGNMFFILLLLALPMIAFATEGEEGDCEDYGIEICQDNDLPKVFLIGEYPEQFELASEEYRLQLLDACEHDMKAAFDKWVGMLQAMEDFAELVEFDIKSVKMWIKVFWAEDGQIDHIAFYLKPNSKNVDVNQLTAFFQTFMNNYKFPLEAVDKYSHYGSASFPTAMRYRKTN
jgi:hypothetical protein